LFGLALVLNDLVLRVKCPEVMWDGEMCIWQLKGFEFIKAVHLDPIPFDMERDLITPTYKKKRPQLLKFYQVQVVKFSGFIFTSY